MVAFAISPGYREADLERAIERALPGTLALGDPGEVARVDTKSRIISKAAVTIAMLALLLGAVVVINTMAMAVIERRTEFGVLAALGWSRSRIVRLILGETDGDQPCRRPGRPRAGRAGQRARRARARRLDVRLTLCQPLGSGSRDDRRLRARRDRRAVLRLAGPPRAAREGDQPIMRRSAGRSRGSRPAENAPGGHAAVGVILTASFLTSFGSGIVTSMTPLCVLALMSLAVIPLGSVIEREKEP